MTLLYLIALFFSVLILIILLALDNIFDQRARIRIQKRLSFDEGRPLISPEKHILSILDDFSAPDFFSGLVDENIVIWSGIPLNHQQFTSLWWLVSLMGLIAGVILAVLSSQVPLGSLLGAILVLFPLVSPYLLLKYRILRREREVEKALPNFLDMLTFTVEAGLGFVPALQRVTRAISGVLGEELQRVLVRFDLGFSKQEALGELVERLPSTSVEHFVEAILLSERLGTSLARTLRVQATLLRLRRRQRAEVQAQTAPIRIIPALVFFFLPSLLLIYLAPPIINFLFRR
jgi:tight adherence protein C